MAKKKTTRADGKAVNFRMTKPQCTSILTLLAIHQRDTEETLTRSSLARKGLFSEALKLERRYKEELPANYIPLNPSEQ
jgi:hypothetical protein